MSYRSKKIRPKLKPLTFIIIGAIVVVITLAVVLLQPSKKRVFYNEFGNTKLAEDHAFEEIKFKKLVKKLENNENLIVFFGTPSDQASRTEVSDYDSEFTKREMNEHFTQIYYVNLEKLKEKDFELLLTYKLNLENIPILAYFSNNELEFIKDEFAGDTNLKKVKEFYLEILESL